MEGGGYSFKHCVEEIYFFALQEGADFVFIEEVPVLLVFHGFAEKANVNHAIVQVAIVVFA